MNNSNKKITVFGGSGFLGRYLIKRLCTSGWEIRVAVRDHEAAQFLRPMGDVGQISIWQTNIMNAEQVSAAVSGVAVVVNLVGILYESGICTFENIHRAAADLIAKASRQEGCERLIHISALGANINSESQYAKTKAGGENCVANAFAGSTILRPSVVFGPEDKFFNMFASFARFLPVLPIYGDNKSLRPSLEKKAGLGLNLYGTGGTKFQPVYVGDVADAILACLENQNTKGKIFELGGPKVYSFKEIIELILSITNRTCLIIPIPMRIAMLQAFFLQLLPKPLITCDQVKLLKEDNITQAKSLGFKDLGIEPMTAEMVVPKYLKRFSKKNYQSIVNK